MRKYIAVLLIIFGMVSLLFSAYLIHERNDSRHVTFTAYPVKPSSLKNHATSPVKIRIASQHISLPISPATIKNNQWQLSAQGVSYLTQSPIPGEYGNSILYGHNWASLLGRLPYIKPGDQIDIQYADNHISHFEVAYTATVSPDQTSILAPSRDRRITIYTCTGFLDTKRFVAVGILKS